MIPMERLQAQEVVLLAYVTCECEWTNVPLIANFSSKLF